MSTSHRSSVAVLALGTLGLLLASARTSAAQSTTPSARAWEFRLTSGALVPTGGMRDALKDAPVTAAQLSWLVRPSLAITGTFGWARSRDLAAVNTPKLDVFTSDLGVELRGAEWGAGRKVGFSPFAGVGGGARSYDYRKGSADATHNLAGYAAVGGELSIGRVGVRLELRDYATGFKSLDGVGASATRNDAVMMVGFRFNRHRAVQR